MRGIIFILTCLAGAGHSWQVQDSTQNLQVDDLVLISPSGSHANRRGTPEALRAFARLLFALDPAAAFDLSSARPVAGNLARIPPAKILCSLRSLPRAQAPFCCVGVLQDISREGDGSCLMEVLSPPQPDGEKAGDNMYAWIHFNVSLPDGTLIRDSRAEGDEELKLLIGAPMQACKGIHLALMRMRIGERVSVICQPKYGYGEEGYPPTIPANATLHWDIELLKLHDWTKKVNEYVPYMPEAVVTEGQEDRKRKDEEQGVTPPGMKNDMSVYEQEAPDDTPPGMKKVAESSSLPEKYWFKDPQASDDGLPNVVFDRRLDDAAEDGGANGGSGDMEATRPGLPSAPRGRHWVPDATRLTMEHHDGYTWRETDPEIELSIPMPASATGPADFSVEIGVRSIRVSVLGKNLIDGEMVGELLKDESSWTFSPSEPGKPGMLQIDLMKKVPASKDVPLWGYLIRNEKEAVSVDAGESA